MYALCRTNFLANKNYNKLATNQIHNQLYFLLITKVSIENTSPLLMSSSLSNTQIKDIWAMAIAMILLGTVTVCGAMFGPINHPWVLHTKSKNNKARHCMKYHAIQNRLPREPRGQKIPKSSTQALKQWRMLNIICIVVQHKGHVAFSNPSAWSISKNHSIF